MQRWFEDNIWQWLQTSGLGASSSPENPNFQPLVLKHGHLIMQKRSVLTFCTNIINVFKKIVFVFVFVLNIKLSCPQII